MAQAVEPVESVWLPFHRRMPDLAAYARAIYARRSFMSEYSKSQRHLEHQDTFFGQLWNVLSPLFMAGVYYALVFVLQGGHHGPEFFVHLLAGVLFFNFISTAARRCAVSVTSSGRLIMNTAFPRAILPLTQVWTSLLQLGPSVAVLLIAQLALTKHLDWTALQAIPALLIAFAFATGLGLLLACSNVYFRDTVAVLPYVTRLWMYGSPVLYYAETIQKMTSHDWLLSLNPVFDTIQIWSGSIARGETFAAPTWLVSGAWALVTLVVGIRVFLSREGEFAVRL